MRRNADKNQSPLSLKSMVIALGAVTIGFFLFSKRSEDAADVIRLRASAPAPDAAVQVPGQPLNQISQPYAIKMIHEMTAIELKQLETLKQIIHSKNDNDPRMDTELRVLGPALREKLREEYSLIPPEKLNDRGTIVFLLGRNLQTEADYRFMKTVLQESPCRSFEDCTKYATQSAAGDDEHSPGEEVTLSYPQQTAFRAVENILSQREISDLSPSEKQWAQDIIEAGMKSAIPSIAARARTLNEQFRQ